MAGQLKNIVLDTYKKQGQDKELYQRKMCIRKHLYTLLNDHLNVRCDLFVVGSTQTQFALKSSDLDLCLVIYDDFDRIDYKYNDSKHETVRFLYEIQDVLVKNNFCTYSEVVSQAVVPVLKFLIDGICVDICINRLTTIRNTFLLSCYNCVDKRVAQLVVAVKSWARRHGINSSFGNTLSSYNLTLMVIHYLQNCNPPVVPCLQSMLHKSFFTGIVERSQPMESSLTYFREFLENHFNDKFVPRNEDTVEKLFAGFILYFDEFDFKNIISIFPNDSRSFPIRFIIIQDPFEMCNTAYSIYDLGKFELIKQTFRDSAKKIKNGHFSQHELL